jgi:hypothetical protein
MVLAYLEDCSCRHHGGPHVNQQGLVTRTKEVLLRFLQLQGQGTMDTGLERRTLMKSLFLIKYLILFLKVPRIGPVSMGASIVRPVVGCIHKALIAHDKQTNGAWQE